MLDFLLVFFITLITIWHFTSRQHPEKFPPGPRCPLPIIGDSYKLGKRFSSGFSKLTKQYGKVVGLWLGPRRAVLISDFDILQDILNKNATAFRVQTKAGRKIKSHFLCTYVAINIRFFVCIIFSHYKERV